MAKGARAYVNGFSKAEFARIVGLSQDMVEYLARQGYLAPTYRVRKSKPQAGTFKLPDGRGVARYYSYRDLVIGRTIQQFCEGGVELRRLKTALADLRDHKAWSDASTGGSPEQLLKWVVFDGKELMIANTEDRHLDPINGIGQRSFGFLVSIEAATSFVLTALRQVDLQSAEMFTFRNAELISNGQRKVA